MKPAPKPLRETKKYSIKFEKTPWKDVCEWYAYEARLNQVGTGLPKGTFTFVPAKSDQQFTLAEIADLFNDALVAQGWLFVRTEKLFGVVPADEKANEKFVSLTDLESLANYGKYQLVEVTVEFGKSDVGDLVDVVRKKLTPFGSISNVPQTNLFVIRELAGNLCEIIKTSGLPIQRPRGPSDQGK
jgi:type II secretory pathway component GspD/PulD (secretin)